MKNNLSNILLISDIDGTLIDKDFKIPKRNIQAIERFKKAGGNTVVDATMPGIGREPLMLKKISEESGLNVIMGTGYYVTSTHPEAMKAMTVEEIADEMVKEITVGVDGVRLA